MSNPNLSTQSLYGSDPSVQETMCFFPDTLIDDEEVQSAGRLITHKDISNLSEADDLLVIQHGLPGIKWRKWVEAKMRDLVKECRSAAALVLIPKGIKPNYDGRDAVDHNLNMVSSDAYRCMFGHPDFFAREEADKSNGLGAEFVMSNYLKSFTAVFESIRSQIAESTRVHAVGQSYGAATLLYTLGHLKSHGMQFPNSATFLSPFTRISLDEMDVDNRLSIINNKSDGRSMFPTHEALLRATLSDCCPFYNVQNDLIDQHRILFGRNFYEGVSDLSEVLREDSCSVRVVRGGRDPAISSVHGELIARHVGMPIDQIETFVPGDGHDLMSFNFGEIISS